MNITGRTISNTSNILEYGAPKYDAVFYAQRLGKMEFIEDANPILAVIPFAQDQMFILKASGSHVVENMLDTRALFQRGPILQEFKGDASTKATELNEKVYVSNTGGLFEMSRGQSKEITRPVRTDLVAQGFSNLALTVDYEKQRIIGGSTMVYEPETDKLYRYNGLAFRFTTRQFHLPNYAPFAADRILFLVEFTNTTQGQLKFQYKLNDGSWSEEATVQLIPDGTQHTWAMQALPQMQQARRLQIRITDITTGKYLKAIVADGEVAGLDDFSS